MHDFADASGIPQPRRSTLGASRERLATTGVAPSSRLLAELAGNHYLAPHSLSAGAFDDLVEYALALKEGRARADGLLDGKSVALVFFNPSLRTRASMAVAVHQLGGLPLVLEVGGGAGGTWAVETRPGVVMDGDKAEHISEMAPVVGSYADMVAVRAFPGLKSYAEDCTEPVLSAFTKLSGIPVINLESSLQHPCQGLGDMLTIREHLGSIKARPITLTWAYHPRALPLAVANSFLSAAALSGADLRVAAPRGFELDPSFIAQARTWAEAGGGSLVETDDRQAALDGSHVVYAKSWTSLQHYGDPAGDQALRSQHKDWIFDDAAFAGAPEARFMHCLPVRRNVEVSDGVLDSPRSLILPEAANRLHGQKALMAAMVLAQRGLG